MEVTFNVQREFAENERNVKLKSKQQKIIKSRKTKSERNVKKQNIYSKTIKSVKDVSEASQIESIIDPPVISEGKWHNNDNEELSNISHEKALSLQLSVPDLSKVYIM